MADSYEEIIISPDVEGPFKVLVVVLMPDDFPAKDFVDLYEEQLGDKTIIVGKLEARSVEQLFDVFQRDAPNYSYSALFIVTHGEYLRGEPHFQDEVFEGQPSRIREQLINWDKIGKWFCDATKDRIVMLAVCHSGQAHHSQSLLHSGFAQHVLAPFDGEEIKSPNGPRAFVRFSEELAQHGSRAITPEDVERAMERVEEEFPSVLDLWSYSGPQPRKYSPSCRQGRS